MTPWAAQHLEEARLAALAAQEALQVATHRQQSAAAESTRAAQIAKDRIATERKAAERVIRLAATLRALEDLDAASNKKGNANNHTSAAAQAAASVRRLPLASMLDVPKDQEKRLAAALDADLDALWIDPSAPQDVLSALLSGDTSGKRLLLLDPADTHPNPTKPLPPLSLGISVLAPAGFDDATRERHRDRLHRWLGDRLSQITWLDLGALLQRHSAGQRPAPGARSGSATAAAPSTTRARSTDPARPPPTPC